MSFASCNYLILQRQQQKNSKYHKLKLDQIKYRDIKSASISYYKRKINYSQQIQNENKEDSQCQEKTTQKPQKESMSFLKPRKIKYAHKFAREPNIHQKSMYSVNKMDKQWRAHCQHFLLASKFRGFSIKENSNECSRSANFINKDIFQNNLKLFEQYNLEEPSQYVFQKPEDLIQRIILIKKSILIYQIPFLVQISTAYNRVFVIAYNMESYKNKTLRLIISLDKARIILSQYDYDLSIVISKVCIHQNKLYIKQPAQPSRLKLNSQSTKPHLQLQKQFIQRNYYQIVLKHKNQQQLHELSKPILPIQTPQNCSRKQIKKDKSSSHYVKNKKHSMMNTLKRFSKYKNLNQIRVDKMQYKLNKILSKVVGNQQKQTNNSNVAPLENNLKQTSDLQSSTVINIQDQNILTQINKNQQQNS